MVIEQRHKVVSLFCGCGGIDLGFLGAFDFVGKTFEALPFQIIWANDADKHAMGVYNHNFKGAFESRDIREVDFGELPVATTPVDVLIAGFPCQEFSLSGPRHGLRSDRGQLYKEVRRALEHFSPKVFLVENVPGIEYPPSIINTIGEALSGRVEPKYDISVHRVNAADYGVPQIRRRVLLVGTRSDIDLHFTPPTPVNGASLTDSNIPTWMKKDTGKNQNTFQNLPFWITAKETIDDLWDSDGPEDSNVPDQNKLTHATIVLGRKKRRDRQLVSSLPAPTIRAQHHGHIEVHYGLQSDGTLRRLTIRECARLQSFPDSFTFPTSASQAYQQIGNAMPPVLVHHWARAVSSWLDASDERTRSKRSPEVTSRIMRHVKAKNSKAELALGKSMWAKGLRYRKHVSGIIGTPDFAFKGLKIAVFCDGDFWHGKGWEKRGFTSWEQQFERLNSPEVWRRKIAANMARDDLVDRELKQKGWTVLRFLESEVLNDADKCAEAVYQRIESKQPQEA